MEPRDTPPEVVEAIDEVFQEEPIPAPGVPAQPAPVQSPPANAASPEPLPRVDSRGKVGDAARPGSPFKDYVRELQQEFEAQQENGEILS
jgi:hypothetical protein